MSISQMMLPEFDHEMANTRKMLDRVPEKSYEYKPHEKSMALGNLAGHLAEMPKFANMVAENDGIDFKMGEHKPFIPSSHKELMDTFDAKVAAARTALAGITDEQMMKTWTLSANGKEMFSMPRVAVIRTMVFSHIIHHRAQLGVYLRMNHVEIPGMYGPSADEMKAWTAQSA